MPTHWKLNGNNIRSRPAKKVCGVKGRTIFTNFHKAGRVLQGCDGMCSAVAMRQSDLEKAFDHVPRDWLQLGLEHVAVRSVMRKGVRMSCKGCKKKLVINKLVEERIGVQRCNCSDVHCRPSLPSCIYIE